MTKPALHIAIPAMDEADYLPSTMAALFAQQTDCPVHIHVCVNQPEEYWQQHLEICENNRQTLHWLMQQGEICRHQEEAGLTQIDCGHQLAGCFLSIIDRSSRGRGWKGKQQGVGMARKTLFESILTTASDDDLIVSLDADTYVEPGYLQSLADNFRAQPQALALEVPYYHPLSGSPADEAADRAILRYEIYMRCYHLNMLRIGSPYAFTALGSAMAFPCHSYRHVGGMTPAKSGEDFYLLQKFCKAGPVLHWNSLCVYPSARLSTRVGFGTGPALIKGCRGDWHSYPVYPASLFDQVEEAYRALPELFVHDVSLPFLDFLATQFKEASPWQPLRDNFKDLPHFVRAFHEKADALRILQFLKQQTIGSDARALDENLKVFARLFSSHLSVQARQTLVSGFSHDRIEEAPTSLLVCLRDQLFQMETLARKNLPRTSR